ncbi:RHS repeat-associated core domain-containing protein [Amycolatopsis sp., V23-08]|uniref:RHS repeat-associated core domain-containing protein n=1 Tax=Amycolatopsis heterodermiae TaxID=3110235 RepID=A0ABU5R2F8_9PSEU|nr:RHS repeat-associated core domain-containing protein [Amycolatopsis sp., V23-08]MEA5360392.1 RHS repeat-associated core domain-containing protein [Amycolatopsis sp., V23-08]
MSNPLVAETKDSTKAYSGVSLLESAADLKSAIESGDWASVAMGAVGTALDALSMAMDPFGAILAAGVGWLMEHVGPLKEALNGLTGNADEIAAQSETWKNIATELGSIGEDLTGMVKADTVSWTGNAADTYRQRADDTVTLLATAQKGCEGASSGVKTAGEVVAAVRALVRDIIAELIGHLISWALQVVFTLGIGLTWVVPQVINAVAKTASKIADLVKRLVTALKALIPLLKRAGDLFSDAAKALRKIKPGKSAPPPKHADINGNPKGLDGPKGKGGDSTTPSGAKGDGDGTHSSGADAPPKTDPPPASKGPDDTPKSPDGDPPPSDTPKGGDSTTSSGAKGDGSKGPDRNTSETKEPVCKEGSGDPIDVETGDVLVTESDLVVPGPLGQLIVRNHVSSYRAGRWFGPSWASLVDERLTVADGTVTYHSADAMILRFPVPAPGRSATSPHGPLRRLHAQGTEYVVENPARGTLHRFVPADGDPDLLLLKEIRTEAGGYVELDHDADGAPALLTHSGGARIAFDVDGGRIRAVRALSDGGDVLVARYDYDAHGHLSLRTNSSSRPAQYTHDPEGRITGWTNHIGAWYRYVYDQQGRCVRGVGDQGFLDASLVYGDRRTSVADSAGRQTVYEFDENGNTVALTDRTGGVTRREWGPRDVLLARTDPLGRRTEFEHDAQGRLVSVLRADGSRVLIAERDDTGLVIEVADGDRVFRRRYTAPNLPDPYTDPLGVTADQHLEQAADPGTAPDAPEPRVEADLFGRPRVIEGAGGRTTFAWTVEGSLREVVATDGTRRQWTFDGESEETSRTDELGRVVRTEYGPQGTVTATVDAAGARTTQRYDTELRLVAVTNAAGQTWHYAYDAEDRLLSQTDYAGRVTRCEYDAAGQRVRLTGPAGETVESRYDVLGNLTERTSPAGTETYRYDPVGRLVRATGPDGVLELEHDTEGRLTRQTTAAGTTTFDYPHGAKSRRTPSGVDVHWGQTADGLELLRVAGTELTLHQDAAGRTLGLSAGPNPLLRQEFDPAGRLAAQHTPAGATRYHRRPDGSVAAREAPAGGVRYEFDNAGRVTAALHPGVAERYAYDVLGNLISSSPGTGPEAGPRQYAGGVLAAAGAVRYAYDAQGRLVRRTLPAPDGTALTWTFGWDAHDHLVWVRTPDGTRWRYRYDALDRRIAKERLDTAGGVAERVDFAWDGTNLVEARHTAGGALVEALTWIHHPDEDRVVAQARTLPDGRVEVSAVITDEIGTPTELVSPDHGTVSPLLTSLWGLTAAGQRPPTPLRFPGQYFDAETGLHFNVFRYYDPANARYISPDPLGLTPALNPETYVEDPFLAADPLGLTRNSGKVVNYADDPTAFLDDDATFESAAPCKKAAKKRPNPNQGAGNGASGSGSATKKPRTGRYDPPLTGNDNVSHGNSGRTVMEGGGESGGGSLDGSGRGSRPGGTTPAGNHLTDVNELNGTKHANFDPRLQAELDKLKGDGKNGYKPDTDEGYFIKGHLKNNELGGSGTADNMTTLSRKANSQMSGNFESKLKQSDIQIGQFKDTVNRMGDTELQRKMNDWGISGKPADFRKEAQGLKVDYSVTASDNVKWPDARNPSERGIRDHVTLDAEYQGLTPNVQKFIQHNKPDNFLTEFPPKGTKLDTVSGAFDPPIRWGSNRPMPNLGE